MQNISGQCSCSTSDDAALIKCRFGTEKDLGSIVRVVNTAYQRAEAQLVEGNRTDIQDVTKLFQRSNTHFVVLENQHEIVGSVFFTIIPDEKKAFFGMLAVSPTEQGKGYAKMLIQTVEHHAKLRECTLLEIDIINVRQELHSFYGKLGFKPVATIAWSGVGTYPCSETVFGADMYAMDLQKRSSIWWLCINICNVSLFIAVT